MNVTLLGRDRIKKELTENDLSLSDLKGHIIKIPSDSLDYKTSPIELEKSDIYIITVHLHLFYIKLIIITLMKINIITLKKYPELGILTRNYFIFGLNNLI
jgi:hypothetical protein